MPYGHGAGTMTADQRSGEQVSSVLTYSQRPSIDVHWWTPSGVVPPPLLDPPAPLTRPRSSPSRGGPTWLARAGFGVGNEEVDVGAVADTAAIAAMTPAAAGAAAALTPLATASAADATTSAVEASPSPACFEGSLSLLRRMLSIRVRSGGVLVSPKKVRF